MRKGWSERRRDLLAGLFLFSLPFLFLWPVTFGGRVLLPVDNLYAFPPWQEASANLIPHNELISDLILQNYPWRLLAKEALSQGELPLWNPYIFSGTPFLAAGQNASLYPLGVIFHLMPIPQAYGWFSGLHLALAGLLMYLFLRLLGCRPGAGVVGGVAFAFSSFMVTSLVWPMVISGVAWLPGILASAEAIFQWTEGKRRHPLPWALLGAGMVGLMLLAGHMEINFYGAFTLAVYSLGRLAIIGWRRGWVGALKGGGAVAGMGVLGIGLGVAQLLPFLELVAENYREGLVGYEEVVGYALPPKHLAAFLMPDFFGNPTHHSYWDVFQKQWLQVTGATDPSGAPRTYPFWGVKNYVEGAAYGGILPLLLGAVALFYRRCRYTGIFAAYAVFCLLLAFGTPLYRLFFFGIPGFNQLHTPFRWLIPYSLSLAVLAGLGADSLLRARVATRVGLATTLVATLALLALALTWLFHPLGLGLAEQALARSQALARAFSTPSVLYSYQFRNFFFLGIFLLASGLVIMRRKSGLMVGVLVADLLAYGYSFNTAADPNLLELDTPAISFLQQDDDRFRVVSFGYEDTLPPNSGLFFGIQDARGYDTIILRRYVEFWRLMEDPHGLLYNRIHKLVTPQALNSPLLDFLNIKYVVTTQEISQVGFELAYQGEVNIYRNQEYLPRAYAVFSEVRAEGEAALTALDQPSFDPRRQVVVGGAGDLPVLNSQREMVPARVVDYTPNRVKIEADMPQEGYLVVSDVLFPGWRATSEGDELPILQANHTFRAVRLGPGEHTVAFAYSPDSVRLGLLVSLLSGALVAMGWGYWGWRRLYGETGEISVVRRVAKNTVTPMSAQLINRAMDFAFAIFMLRYLGPENAGKFAFAVVVIGYFLIVTDFGLGTLLTREVARARDTANRYLANTIALRLMLVAASFPLLLALVAIYVWRLGLTDDTGWTILIFGLSLIPSGLAGALSSVFNAYEKMEYPAAVTIVINLVRISLGVGALLMGWGILGLAGASVAASLVSLLALYLLVRRTLFRPRWQAEAPFSRELVKESAPLMINNLLSTVFFRMDVMLIQPMRGSAATGWYTTAYKFIDGLNIIPAFFTLALFPIMSRYADASRSALTHAYHRALRLLILISLPITVGTGFIARDLVIFFFGEAYAPAVLALQILIWFLPFSYINSVTQYVLIAVHRQRFLTLAFIIGVTFNFVANLVVIPAYSFYGAAVVTIISEIVLLGPFYYAIRQELGPIPWFSLGWRPVLASAAMGLVLWTLSHWGPLALVAVGAATYLASLFLLGTFDEEDRAMGRALLGR